MKEITVQLAERSYPICISADLLSQQSLLKSYITGRKVCIVTNDTVADLYLDSVKRGLTDFEVSTVLIEDGEQYKNLESFSNIIDHLLSQNIDRKTTVIALGGGVIGDLAGFAAASCLRGINFIQIPTTLLAQVDSSVGGKTGVNHAQGKNLIGAFYQPSLVLADIATLASLSDRQFAAGMAEVIKYGLIYDADFFLWLEQNVTKIKQRDNEALVHIVKRSCEIKAEVVAQDEREAGIRAILNLGHTFGHAIEAAVAYQGWLHGEAISVGMVMAAELSLLMGQIEPAQLQRIIAIFQQFDLPITPPDSMTAEQMKALMLKDKKTINGNIRLILLQSMGQAYVCEDYSPEFLDKVIVTALGG